MKRISIDTLEEYSRTQPLDGPWIRIGMDTGGIAAGAGKLLDYLEGTCRERDLQIPVTRTGSYGYSHIDPLVEVKMEGAPAVLYGCVNLAVGKRILDEHFGAGRLVDDHVVADRRRATEMGEGVTTHVLIQDTTCEGGDKTQFFQASMEEEIRFLGLTEKVQVVRALDMGLYGHGLVIQLLPSRVTYTNVLTRDISRIVEHSIRDGELFQERLCTEPDSQVRIVLRNCGILDPESIEDALRYRAYQALGAALRKGSPDEVIESVKRSELRGRGGAGFPTGLKWQLTRQTKSDLKYVICNGDEGDPGAFMDRSVMEGDPHSVIEGLMLAGYAIGARKGFFYIRAEYPLAIDRIQKALDQARERGLLGENILGSGWDFDAEIRLGAGAFVCGEETALIASVEGKRGSPEPRPPFPSVKGLWGKPTCINNVETLAAIPPIIDRGPEWYAGFGSGKSRGTKVFAVTGKVRNPQLVEVPMGTTIRTIVYDICGGVLDDLKLKGVQTGGPSGGVIPEEHLDTPISYETLQELGSIMGSGGMLVMDETDCMVDVATFYLKFCVDESCGKCAPCRVGGFQMLQMLETIGKGRGSELEIAQIERICRAMKGASLCGLGQTAPNPVLSTLRYFRNEYTAYIEGGPRYARQRKKALMDGPQKKAG